MFADFGGSLTQGFTVFTEGIDGSIVALGELVSRLFDSLYTELGSFFSTLGGGISQGFAIVTDGITGSIVALGESISSLFSGLISSISELLDDLVDNFKKLLIFLFVPSDNLGTDLKEKIDSKFPFIEQVYNVIQPFFNIGGSATLPDFNFTYYGATVSIINFDLLEDYIPVVHTIIISVSWSAFIFRLYKRIPSIIGGFK